LAERYQGLTEDGKLLCVSFFRDENSAVEWRNSLVHRKVLALGGGGYFSNYRLGVAEVLRDCAPDDQGRAPIDTRAIHD
jgi:heme-degrading monooxygenase HmoA